MNTKTLSKTNVAYKPETHWIGGTYPGVATTCVPQYVDIEKRIRERKAKTTQIQLGPTVDLVLAAIRANGPISLIQLTVLTGRSDKTIYARIAGLLRSALITKELCKNKHNHQKSFFYSGVQ
jgi:hypothetical protein